MERSPIVDRIRLAIVEAERTGVTPTSRFVREHARCDARKVEPVLRAWRAGTMPPLSEPWTEEPAARSPEVEQLEEEIQEADTVARLEVVGRRVTVAILRGDVSPRVGDLVLAGLREQRQAMRMRMLEQQVDSVRSIEVLTPEEQQVLEAHRKARRPQPLKPAEGVEPP